MNLEKIVNIALVLFGSLLFLAGFVCGTFHEEYAKGAYFLVFGSSSVFFASIPIKRYAD